MRSEMRVHWRIVVACFAGLAVCVSPAYMMTLGLFLKNFSEEYGWNRTEVSSALAVVLLTASLLTPLVGGAIDRYGVRPIILTGTIFFPVILLLYGILPMSYTVYLLLAVATGCASSMLAPSSYLNLPQQYFDKQLGLAIGLGVLGMGFGQMCLPLLTQHFIRDLGYHGAWVALAAFVAVVGLANVLFLVRDNPARYAAPAVRNSTADTGSGLGGAIREPLFWQLTFSFLLISMVTGALVLHLPSILTDRGLEPETGALAVSLLGFGSLIARLITGVMLDRMSPAIPAVLFIGGQVIGCMLLGAGASNPVPLIAALLIGSALGAEADMMPFILRRAFDPSAFGRIYGLCFGLLQIGGVGGALFAGLIYDRLGSYDALLYTFAVTSAIALLLMVTATLRLLKRGPCVQPMPAPSTAG